MTLVAYARVSTDDQTTALQLDALNKAGAVQIFEEQASGGRWDRPELHAMLAYLRAGDTVLVWKIDRLSRSLSDLVRIMELIDQRGAALEQFSELRIQKKDFWLLHSPFCSIKFTRSARSLL